MREALAAEYEIIEELGRGGMALVYRARDRQLEREVAIKVLPFSLAFDAEFVERFQREARTAAQLEHPEHHPDLPGRPVRPGHLLRHEVPAGRLAVDRPAASARSSRPPEIRRLLLEAGGALGYAAQRGIVHRDIKPDNIMFDEFGQCLLTDFGIAKAASGQKLTGTGMSIGTPHYMSPEQARAQAIDGRSDIYSLGVVAYQCLTGTVPYDGEDSFSIGYKHITEPIPTPSLITADERRIFEVIKRMLMKDPADRYQSCEELVASIQGQPTAAAGRGPGLGRGGRHGGRSVEHAHGAEPERRRPADREPADHADRLAAGQPAGHAARAAGPAAAGGRPLARDARRAGVVLGLALGRAGGARRRGRRLLLLQVPRLRARHRRRPPTRRRPRADTTPLRDTTAARTPAPPGDSAPRGGSAPAPAPAPAPPRPPRRRARRTARRTADPVTGDSGGIRVVGLPRGSTVMIDEKPVSEPRHPAHSGPARRRRLGAAVQLLLGYHRRPAGRDRRGEPAAHADRLARPAPAPAADARRRPLRAGPGLQRRRLVLRRAAQAGHAAVRAGARRGHRDPASFAPLGEGVHGGADGGRVAAPPLQRPRVRARRAELRLEPHVASRAQGRARRSRPGPRCCSRQRPSERRDSPVRLHRPRRGRDGRRHDRRRTPASGTAPCSAATWRPS